MEWEIFVPKLFSLPPELLQFQWKGGVAGICLAFCFAWAESRRQAKLPLPLFKEEEEGGKYLAVQFVLVKEKWKSEWFKPETWMAAPWATTSSGLILLHNSFPEKNSDKICWTLGIFEEPPTRIISSIWSNPQQKGAVIAVDRTEWKVKWRNGGK